MNISQTTTKYQTYPKYKPSGIDWLGEIPERWVLRRCGDVAEIIVGFAFDSEKFTFFSGVPLVRIRDIDSQETVVNFDGTYDTKYLVSQGDTLVGMDGDFNVSIWKGAPALLNQRVLKIKALKNCDQRYLTYLVPIPIKSINDITYSTTVKHLSEYAVRKIHFYIPDKETQLTIADFLDRETEKIDEVVEKKQKLIELLLEKRQAIISQAVTKGLNPKAKMKASGIPWLEKVPINWLISPLRRVGEIVNGSTPSSVIKNYWDGDIMWITPDDLGNNNSKLISDSQRKITPEGYRNCGTELVPPGSLIMSTRAPIGHLAINSRESCFNQGCKGIVLNKNMNPTFYYYYFLFCKEILNAYGRGSTFVELGTNELLSFPTAVPPKPEQSFIASYLDQYTERVDKLIEKIRVQNQKLQEFRQALISNVVTGKVKIN